MTKAIATAMVAASLMLATTGHADASTRRHHRVVVRPARLHWTSHALVAPAPRPAARSSQCNALAQEAAYGVISYAMYVGICG